MFLFLRSSTVFPFLLCMMDISVHVTLSLLITCQFDFLQGIWDDLILYINIMNKLWTWLFSPAKQHRIIPGNNNLVRGFV